MSERQALDRVLDSARQGQSAVLVVRGEAGIGKTELLRYVVGEAAGFHVARAAGVEAEMELPFAGLHQLCAPMLGHLDALPAPQREAARVVLGLATGGVPDPFLVGLAVLGLLSAVAADRPLLCAVEDAQWLDGSSSQVLGFVARRLAADSVAMVVAIRGTTAGGPLQGLPELALEGLDHDDARTLLRRAVPGRLADRVRERIIAETGGNPLALLELPRYVTPADLGGGLGLPAAGNLPAQIEERYVQRIADLPDTAQRLILLAAAEPTGDATLVWRGAEMLGIQRSALAAGPAAELLQVGANVRFRHPLVRSAVYKAASPGDRRLVHETLAALSDPEHESDRRAWHRALAAAGPDEDVAAELEHSAGRAQQRGGLAAAATFLAKAAELTVDAPRRAARAMAAAQARHQAGGPDAALALLAVAESGPLDELRRAEAQMLRAQIAFTSRRGRDAPALLLDAARRLEALDATMARDTYLQALMAAQLASRFAADTTLEIAKAARRAPRPPVQRIPDTLLDGFALLITEGHAAGAPLIKRALHDLRTTDAADSAEFMWLILAEVAALEVWDHDAFLETSVRELEIVRAAGALTVLSTSLSAHIIGRVLAGELATAASLLDEQKVVTEASGSQLAPHAALMLGAWRGRLEEFEPLAKATIQEFVPRGEGVGLNLTQWGAAVLYNGLGLHEEAMRAAQELLDTPRRFDQTIGWGLAELVEAAAGCGQLSVAQEALVRLSELTQAAGSDWSMGIEARCRAVLAPAGEADEHYREAIERLAGTRLRGEHARAHLLFGERLRGDGRRADALEHLRTAHRMFTEMGAEAFAERAAGGLRAAGDAVDPRPARTRKALTRQETQVARLARQGLSNADIGARLFLSPRTVEWHLSRVFAKLGVGSRNDLAGVLEDFDDAAPEAVHSGRSHLKPRDPASPRRRAARRRPD